MPQPYELYIRFLITTGIDDITFINNALDNLNLPSTTQAIFDAQYNLVSSSVPGPVLDQIEKRQYCGDFLQWMKVLEVDELWYFEKPFRDKKDDDTQTRRSTAKLTYDIHQDIKLRLAINALLIKAVPLNDLMQSVNVRFASLLKEEHVRIYEKYFFNPRRMTRTAWTGFLSKCDDREKAIYFIALSEPLDVLRTELELPAKISSSSTLQYLLTKSYMRAKQYLNIGTPEAGREAREWIDATIKLIDKYEKYRSSDMEDFSKSLQMSFDYVDTDTTFPVPDPDVLKEISAKLKKEKEDKDSGEGKTEG